MTDKELVKKAISVRKNSYSPYSNFKVGAALLTENGKVFTGCNIENLSFSPTICAERVAIFKAISEGENAFLKIAIAGGKNDDITEQCYPCGVCRQVMREFCNDDFKILIVKANNEFDELTLAELLPNSFKANLGE